MMLASSDASRRPGDDPRLVAPTRWECMSTDLIARTGRAAPSAGAPDRFRHSLPHLAVAGLNPHAGENGAMGSEEADIIEPAIRLLKGEGLSRRRSPFRRHAVPPGACANTYDAAICMYHDQALIPLKALDMDGGVNITLGLPFVRTSPDHGTALGIAGLGTADPGSLIAAIRMAHKMAYAPDTQELIVRHIRLGVNIDHVATLRNARGGTHPDPVLAAKLAARSGRGRHYRAPSRGPPAHSRRGHAAAQGRSCRCR